MLLPSPVSVLSLPAKAVPYLLAASRSPSSAHVFLLKASLAIYFNPVTCIVKRYFGEISERGQGRHLGALSLWLPPYNHEQVFTSDHGLPWSLQPFLQLGTFLSFSDLDTNFKIQGLGDIAVHGYVKELIIELGVMIIHC